MSKLNEIEAASEELSAEEKRQLIVFLAGRIHESFLSDGRLARTKRMAAAR